MLLATETIDLIRSTRALGNELAPTVKGVEVITQKQTRVSFDKGKALATPVTEGVPAHTAIEAQNLLNRIEPVGARRARVLEVSAGSGRGAHFAASQIFFSKARISLPRQRVMPAATFTGLGKPFFSRAQRQMVWTVQLNRPATS